jgi:hypothetical protein
MTDIESSDSLVRPTETKSSIIRVFGSLDCRIKEDTLKLRELHRLTAILLSVFSICSCSITFMRSPVSKYGLNIRWLPVTALFITTGMYILKFANVKMGGWGAADSRFWCDVRIMYVRGFNTVRTIFNWLSSSVVFGMLTLLMGVESSVLFILMLNIVADWQAGMAENQNQYDIKFQDRFSDENEQLCLESLHHYHKQHVLDKIAWTPFAIACFLKTYLLSCMIFYSDGISSDFVFAVPMAILIVLWVFLIPCFLNFVYFKQAITFCNLEIYRILTDCVVPPLLVMFTLV